ncbi:MAG: class I SAM-dependent methyltransferase [Candidatus Omnitrophica bacterium]|nr:class I SAM-dependent methyltransferase [Candidatus Omnitrophota bacterium]
MPTIENLYSQRFNENELRCKNELWKILCQDYLKKYIPIDSAVLDLGAGYCEFINNIGCKSKIAVDINPDMRNHAASGVQAIIASCTDLKGVSDNSVDIVFSSEFFEHLKNTDELFAALREIHRVLRKDGRIIIICPNIRYVGHKYWDFIDHRLPLTHAGIREALLMHGFSILKLVPRFLPYTTKSCLPKSTLLLKIYLNIPVLWRFLGSQMFVVAKKN